MVTPLAQRLLNWGVTENSLLYVGCGLEVNIIL